MSSSSNRREFLHQTISPTLLLGASAACAPQSVAVAEPRKKATAFALIGDRFHNSDYIRSALGKTLVREAGLSIDFTDDVESLSEQTLDGYRLLILFRDGCIWPYGYGGDNTTPGVRLVSDPPLPNMPVGPINWMVPATRDKNYRDWMTESQALAVKNFVERGASALFYHNTTHIGRVNPVFREVHGGATQLHPPIRPFKVRVVNPDHPITQGGKDFVITDEQHYMDYDKDPKRLLLQSVNLEGQAFGSLGPAAHAGWAYDYGQGRVCYLAPGHMISVLWNPEYEKIQKNAVRWLLRET